MQTTRIIAASAATALALSIAYAIYFDHRRRNDPDFRRNLAREHKKHRRAQKQAEAAESESRKTQIHEAVRKANEEGYPDPKEVEEREAYFMDQVASGEQLLNGGKEKEVEAALCFYKALKVYPDPKNLVGIYQKTVPKNVLDILADALAYGDDELLAEAVE